MIDRSWMLNHQAIRTAKDCINLVKDELDIKLTLSHPEFMELLHSYVELTDSQPLAEAYSRLLSMAGVGNVIRNIGKSEAPEQKIVPISENMKAQKAVGGEPLLNDEMVEYNGKLYQRWMDGMEFKGLYRGQAHYA